MPRQRTAPRRVCPACDDHYYVPPGRFARRHAPYCSEACAYPDRRRLCFWAKVDKAGPFPASGTLHGRCWLWLASVVRGGYGRFNDGTRTLAAHRFAYEDLIGPVPEGLVLRHKVCSNPRCVNPAHLEPGTQKENIADAIEMGTFPAGDAHWSRLHPERVSRGSRRPQAKLTEADVAEIRQLAALGFRRAELAARFGVNVWMVGRIIRRTAWKHVP